jgi:hypothetical protein
MLSPTLGEGNLKEAPRSKATAQATAEIEDGRILREPVG